MSNELNSGYASEAMVKEAFDLLPKYINHIQNSSKDLASRIFNEQAYSEDLGPLIDKVSSLIRLFSIVHSEAKLICQDSSSNESVKGIKIHLLSLLKAIKSAYLDQDRILLADLLEYELQDNLTQWKISVIPMLKRMTRHS